MNKPLYHLLPPKLCRRPPFRRDRHRAERTAAFLSSSSPAAASTNPYHRNRTSPIPSSLLPPCNGDHRTKPTTPYRPPFCRDRHRRRPAALLSTTTTNQTVAAVTAFFRRISLPLSSLPTAVGSPDLRLSRTAHLHHNRDLQEPGCQVLAVRGSKESVPASTAIAWTSGLLLRQKTGQVSSDLLPFSFKVSDLRWVLPAPDPQPDLVRCGQKLSLYGCLHVPTAGAPVSRR